MTIWEQVLTALTPLGLPLASDVLIVTNEADRPDAYIVYTVVTSVPTMHADNAETLRRQTVQVSYYNRAGLAGMPDIQGAMAAAGFAAGAQRTVPYSQATRHYGYAMDFTI